MGTKQLFRLASWVAAIAGVGLALYLWTAQAFNLPLGAIVLVLMLGALFLQGESK